MATMTLKSTSGWSYNATGKLTSIVTFKNPSSSERAEISSVVLYLGTVNGTCTAGDKVTGNGGSYTTYLSINETKSNTLTISKVMGVTGNPSYPIVSQAQAYTFTFNPAASVPANGSASILIQTPSGGKVMGFNGKSITITYQNIPNIAPAPTSVTISCTSFTATSINWRVSTGSAATECRVYLDGSLNSTKSMSGNSATGTMSSVRSTTHTLRAEARNRNSGWVGSNTITVDCTIPSIYNARITPTSTATGTLSFTSNYNVNYSLENVSLGTVNRNVNPNRPVNLKNNSLANYTLKIARTDNTVITNSTVITNVDARGPVITLSYTVTGTTCSVTATADSTCRDWTYSLDGTSYSISAGSTNRVTFTINNMTVNHRYTLIVYATRVSSGLRGSSSPVYPEPKGCVRIFDNNGNGSAASVYIYVASRGSWVQAIPYVWQDGYGWRMGT